MTKQPDIPLCIPNLDEHEKQAVLEVLDSGWLAHGPYNKKFEQEFSELVGVRHSITCNSCTSALFLALVALDIRGEVLIPSFSFVATANAVVTAGATPVFVDIDPKTMNMSPEDLKARITPKSQAIIPVHYAGQCCDMDAIVAIAEKHGLRIIEDSAETIGGTYKDKQAGSFGIGCFSFFPTKNITTGEGGMLTTNDDALAQRLKALIGHGIDSTTYAREKSERPWFRSAVLAGYNFRMSNILAAIGYWQMKKIRDMNQKRQEHSAYLIKGLEKLDWLELPYEAEHCKHVYQMFVPRLKDPARRGEIIAGLNEKGIKASVHFDPPIHEQGFYKGQFPSEGLEQTELAARSLFTLPMFPQLTKDQLDRMIDAINAL